MNIDELAEFIKRANPDPREAFTILGASGVASTGSPCTSFKLDPPADEESLISTYLQAHEFIHLTQVATTSACRKLAIEILQISASIERADEHQDIEARVDELRRIYEVTINRASIRLVERPSMCDVMEMHAFIEGFKTSSIHQEHRAFLEIAKRCHELSENYTVIVGYWAKHEDMRQPLELLPKVCWLSLQCDDPAAAYWDIAGEAEQHHEQFLKMNTRQLADAFYLEERVEADMVARWDTGMEELWKPYIEAVAEVIRNDPSWDTLAHPSKLDPKTPLMPSLFIFNDGMMRVDGPAIDAGLPQTTKWVWAAEPVVRNLARLQN